MHKWVEKNIQQIMDKSSNKWSTIDLKSSKSAKKGIKNESLPQNEFSEVCGGTFHPPRSPDR